MRNFKRNCRTVTFCELLPQVEILEDDLRTGTYIRPYGEKQSVEICVSANKGDTELTMFGQLEDYDRVMTTADRDCPITETCVLWVDADTESTHDYIVRSRAKSLNGISYAIKRVNLRE